MNFSLLYLENEIVNNCERVQASIDILSVSLDLKIFNLDIILVVFRKMNNPEGCSLNIVTMTV